MLSMFRKIKFQGGLRGGLLLAVMLSSFMAGSLPAVQAQEGAAPDLFSDAGVAAADAAGAQPSHVVRSRTVGVNLGLLLDESGAARDVSGMPQVALNLFPDANYTGVITRLEKDRFSTSWIGRLAEVEGGYFYLVVADGAFIAHVASQEGIYEVSSAGDSLYRIVQIDQSQLRDDAPGKYAAPGPVLAPADISAQVDSGGEIDVMVVYTPAALAAEGSLAAMKARIALAMTETNDSYANAGITPRLRLVHIHQVTYTESGSLETDKNRLKGTADSYMTNVHTLRDTYGADMVSLIVASGDACGIAAAIMATASTAFQVTNRDGCMTGYYSFGHEFGHLQGAQHDMYADPSTVLYSYAHGYVYLPDRWRTVMAYNDLCETTSPYTSCTRLQYWSNDTNTYGGAAMGDANSRNYLVLNNTAATVANFRTRKIAGSFNSTFVSSSSGWTPVYGTWTLASSSYYKSVGVGNGTFSSIKRTGTYGDVTFESRMKRTSSQPNWANGLILRGAPTSLTSYKAWMPSYWFAYTNSGQFSVWEYSAGGVETALQPWTTSAAITTTWNKLKVTAVGSRLNFWINGTLVWTGTDTSFTTGQLGLAFYRSSSTTNDQFFVDYARGSTSPTADALVNPLVVQGTVHPGGDPSHSP